MAAVPETVALYDALMKELYTPARVENVAIRNRTWYKKISKRDGMRGEYYVVPIVYANGAGRSASDSVAFQNQTGSKKLKFQLSRAMDFGSTQLRGELLHASKTELGAYIEAMKLEVDTLLDEVGHSTSIRLYGNTGGARGRRLSLAGEVVTLTVKEDAHKFYRGMILQAAGTDGTSGAVGAGTATVASVNEQAGTVTLEAGGAAALNGGAFVNNDYLFQYGDFGSGTVGLESWIPLTAPTGAETYLGTTASNHRGLDPSKLAGFRLNDTSMPTEEIILRVCEGVFRQGGRPDVALISHSQFTKLTLSRESKVTMDAGGMGDVGFKGFPIHYSGGVCVVMADPDCPPNRVWCLTSSTWSLYHLGGLPHIIKDDGLMATRASAADAVEVRVRAMYQQICYAPAWNGVGALSTDGI
jgi:hypothetical protein